jgi:hypothetical protein
MVWIPQIMQMTAKSNVLIADWGGGNKSGEHQLGQSSPACFQTCWKEIKILILGEKSMVGRSQVGHIDHCLCQAHPQNADEILGGIPAIFFGDFVQLPPVGDSPMYSNKQSAYCTALHAVCLSHLISL